MKHFVGIDLGTTNSAICSYNGEELHLWKSPEQTDVTPSAIFIDRRGNKFYGKKAYDSAPTSPDNAALGFKRLMGSSTPVTLKAVNLTMKPEEASAEILRVLFGYLPEEVRNGGAAGTVITVPAAFNQMQKDATLQAAELAGIGKVALMQEPVAAIMAIMRARKTDGAFVVYDLGGGTLDIAVAQSVAGRVNLLAHGGIAMCGGRDFDRLLVEEVVRPWLAANFDLPEELEGDKQLSALPRLAAWAAEQAKIDLSAREESKISLTEETARLRDRSGRDIYLDIPVQRTILDRLIDKKVTDSIAAALETLQKAGLTASDVDRVVFVGGPTHYKPLRDRIVAGLGIPGSTDVNPMTAVAEGAAVFAESIEWESERRGRKGTRGSVSSSGALKVTINYIARTPDVKAKVALRLGEAPLPGSEFQVDSLDTGWTSGRLPLRDGASLDVPLHKNGENAFKVFVFDPSGGSLRIEPNKVVVTRAAATVDGIPASHSVGLELQGRQGGRSHLFWLVRKGEPLPKKGHAVFRAGESLRSGSSGSLNFKLWEGEIEDVVDDNRHVGVFKVRGTDFVDGVIAAGAELQMDFEVADSGAVSFEVSVPSIGGAFHSGQSFYSRQDGELDYTASAGHVAEEGTKTKARLDAVAERVSDPKLDEAQKRVAAAVDLKADEKDPETAKQAMDDVLEARRLLAQVRKDHQKEIRQLELDEAMRLYDGSVREFARPTEQGPIDTLFKTAQRSIDRGEKDFESHLDDLRGRFFEILWRQDWFVVQRFKFYCESPQAFADRMQFQQLVVAGQQAMKASDLDRLREIVGQLSVLRIGSTDGDSMFDAANIVRA